MRSVAAFGLEERGFSCRALRTPVYGSYAPPELITRGLHSCLWEFLLLSMGV